MNRNWKTNLGWYKGGRFDLIESRMRDDLQSFVNQVEKELGKVLYPNGFHVQVGYQFLLAAETHESKEKLEIVLVPKNLYTDYAFEVLSLPSEIDFPKLGTILLSLIESGKPKYAEESEDGHFLIHFQGEKKKTGWKLI